MYRLVMGECLILVKGECLITYHQNVQIGDGSHNGPSKCTDW